jgi:Tfp pilus assembly protein PilF
VDLAGGWLAAGDRTRAEECLRIALELAPDHGAAQLRRAAIMAGDGREGEAALLVDGGFAVDPWAGPRLHTGKR